jgi:hypothetical protein
MPCLGSSYFNESAMDANRKKPNSRSMQGTVTFETVESRAGKRDATASRSLFADISVLSEPAEASTSMKTT